MGILHQIWLYEIIGIMLLMCQNTSMRAYGAWIETYYVSCSKTYRAFDNVSQSSASSRQATRSARICETVHYFRTLWWDRRSMAFDSYLFGCCTHSKLIMIYRLSSSSSKLRHVCHSLKQNVAILTKCHHWFHQKLWNWHLLLQSVKKMSSKWRHIRFFVW